MIPADDWLEAVLRREGALTLLGVFVLVAIAWGYLVRTGREMSSMAAMGMMPMEAWTIVDVGLAAAMWAVMMVGMMLPTAAPMVLMFTSINRKRRAEQGPPYVDTGLFTLAYIGVWGTFSVAAALAQWGLQATALLSEDAMRATPLVGAALLVAAGIYQLTPLKYACLKRCQTPIGFILSEWREGRGGAFVMGVRHGVFCLGCCWVLMALLFVGGVMNLIWVAAITAFVLAEKLVTGRAVSWMAGAALLVWGIVALRKAW